MNGWSSFATEEQHPLFSPTRRWKLSVDLKELIDGSIVRGLNKGSNFRTNCAPDQHRRHHLDRRHLWLEHFGLEPRRDNIVSS